MASPAHASGDEPIGYLLPVGNRYAGVALTAVSWGDDPAEEQAERVRRVNLASWYIEPEQRLKFPILLRQMLHDPKAAYYDLTPSPEVRPILEKLGFVPLNDGVLLVNLAMAAVRPPNGATVRVLEGDTTGGWLSERTIVDHVDYGCLALQIADESGWTNVLVKPARVKGLPLVELIACEDDAVVLRHIGVIARRLLRMGHVGLLLDMPLDGEGFAKRPGAGLTYLPMPSRRRRYAKNARPTRGTDYTYTELVFFPN